VVQALELCDQILLVTLLDVPTLHHVRRQRAVLERLRIPASRVKLVTNRYSSADAVDEGELRRFLGAAPAARLPNDYAGASAAANQGESLARIARGSRLARAFERLALDVHAWCGLTVPERESQGRLSGWLRALGAWRKNGTR
jgi:Flp pilus assembly CpaE family ATPase